MAKVFVAYAQEDVERVRSILIDLRKHTNIQFWFAEDQLSSGQDIRAELKAAVQTADSFLYCVSSHSGGKVKSSFIAEERRAAVERRRRDPTFQIHVVRIARGGRVPLDLAPKADVDLSSAQTRVKSLSRLAELLESKREERYE